MEETSTPPEDDGDPLVGKVIHDRFRIIAPIARGGMGAVYKAEQAPLGRLVALKVLSPKHDEEKDPEFRKRFFLEAATVAKLSHPNTVTVFDYGQSDGLFFIVMELLNGITLKRAIKLDAPFPPERAVHIAKQISRSLREAHRLGVIHRDMKPGNVMLLEQGDEHDYVKVLDFGLVKDIDKTEDEEDLTQAGVFMGSPKYMSPEQIQGERIDGRSDVYSLGVLLYEMLTGAPPFVRDKQVQVLMDHIHAPVPDLDPGPDHPPIPPELSQIVLKCLAKKPDDRFADMDSLLVALKLVAGELALPLPPSGELGMTGEYPLGGTPVSGIHSLGLDGARQPIGPLDPLRQSASFTPSSTSGRLIPSGLSGPLDASPSVSPPIPAQGGASSKLALVFGGLAVLLAALIVLLVVDPLGDDEVAPAVAPPAPDLAEVEPSERAQTPPPVEEPVEEAPATIRSVLIELDSVPSGATVRIGEQEYGPTPAQVELTGELAAPGRELTFVFTRAGHREMTVTRAVPSDGTLEVSARMRRVLRPRRGGGDEPPARGATPAGYRDSPY